MVWQLWEWSQTTGWVNPEASELCLSKASARLKTVTSGFVFLPPSLHAVRQCEARGEEPLGTKRRRFYLAQLWHTLCSNFCLKTRCGHKEEVVQANLAFKPKATVQFSRERQVPMDTKPGMNGPPGWTPDIFTYGFPLWTPQFSAGKWPI